MKIQRGKFVINMTKFAAVTKSRIFSHISMNCLDFIFTSDVSCAFAIKAKGGKIKIDLDYYDVFLDNLLDLINIVDIVNKKEDSENISIAEIVGIVENIGYNLSASLNLHENYDEWKNNKNFYHNPVIVKEDRFDLYRYIFQNRKAKNTTKENIEKIQKLVRKYEKDVINLLMTLYNILISKYSRTKILENIVVLPMRLRGYLSDVLEASVKTTSKLSYFINLAFLDEEEYENSNTIINEIKAMSKLIKDIRSLDIDTIMSSNKYKKIT